MCIKAVKMSLNWSENGYVQSLTRREDSKTTVTIIIWCMMSSVWLNSWQGSNKSKREDKSQDGCHHWHTERETKQLPWQGTDKRICEDEVRTVAITDIKRGKEWNKTVTMAKDRQKKWEVEDMKVRTVAITDTKRDNRWEYNNSCQMMSDRISAWLESLPSMIPS